MGVVKETMKTLKHIMKTLMDNCSFLKKDLDCAPAAAHLYVFKYAIISSDGKEIRTTKACEGGKSVEEAEPLARNLVRKLVESDYSGQNVEIKLLKWIQNESEY